jgi:hypothetical protein
MNQLVELVNGDKVKADEIWNVSREVILYSQFKGVQDLGLSIPYDALPFEKAMLFSWIKEAIDNGRKS